MAASLNSLGVVFVLLFHTFTVFSSAQNCTDGSYEHEGVTCCRCSAGQYLVNHCTDGPNSRKCEYCSAGEYSSHPNHQDKCEPCTSCSQPNANLEEEERCTSSSNTKCRCKQDHYCSSGGETCRLCQPCTVCGAEGVKVHCQGSSDTICNEKTEGGLEGGMIAGIVVIIIIIALVAAAGGAVWFLRKRKRQPRPEPQINGIADDVEQQPLNDVDLQPHLHDIAEAIGWKDMHRIAMRTRIPNTVIESVKLNHPNDAEEQTIELLTKWTEKQGMMGGRKLVEILRDIGKKGKASKVTEILTRGTE